MQFLLAKLNSKPTSLTKYLWFFQVTWVLWPVSWNCWKTGMNMILKVQDTRNTENKHKGVYYSYITIFIKIYDI